MNPQDYQLTLILPRDKIAQIKAAAAARGCTPDDLAGEALDRAAEDSAFKDRAAFTAKEIHSALIRGEDVGCLWPDDLNECLVAALILADCAEEGAEQFLLEMNSQEMTEAELACRDLGISYEELMKEALGLLCNGAGEASEEEEEDDSDWWKKP
jgi:hypothetical protein